jgi:DNA-binding ferritin-like protein
VKGPAFGAYHELFGEIYRGHRRGH